MCKIGSVISLLAAINRNIIQDSGLSPLLYYIMEGDLHPISIINLLFKYANDTNLIVPGNTGLSPRRIWPHKGVGKKKQNDN